MEQGPAKYGERCLRERIAAYVDGELSPREEMEMELHFAGCRECAGELNEQKKLLCVLDLALEQERGIELPADFTRVVVANAESTVRGLRCPGERTKAVLVVLGLLLMAAGIAGVEVQGTFSAAAAFAERSVAVGGFFVHLFQDMAIGISVILRTLCFQFVVKSSVAVATLWAFFFLSILVLSRIVFRQRRA